MKIRRKRKQGKESLGDSKTQQPMPARNGQNGRAGRGNNFGHLQQNSERNSERNSVGRGGETRGGDPPRDLPSTMKGTTDWTTIRTVSCTTTGDRTGSAVSPVMNAKKTGTTSAPDLP